MAVAMRSMKVQSAQWLAIGLTPLTVLLLLLHAEHYNIRLQIPAAHFILCAG
ncbi:MAG: hypothetical protein HY660_13055, partial [Armatimonadetes bacterium]|nr:hypothetical protein [Armatimonadota bacterium]